MPIQVLPYVPTPLEQLTPYITDAAGKIGAGIKQRSALKGLQSLLNPQAAAASLQPEIEGAPQAQGGAEFNPINIAQISQLAETALGKNAADALTNTLIQQQKSKEKEASEIRSEQRKAQAEQKKATEEKREHQANVQKTFNVASSLLAKNTPGVGISPGAATGLSRKAVEGRNTFNTLKGKFESILLPMVNKGTLAKERFNFILSQIPDAADSQRAIAGKLRGLAETLSEEGFPIDTKILDSIPFLSKDLKELGKEEKPLEKVEAGTKVTESIARDLLKKAGNDKQKARDLARELGYEF